MSIRFNRQLRRFLSVAVVGTVAVGITACTGRGGGQLPPDSDLGFTGPASFGFSFSCEDKSRLTGPTGQLRIQLSYTDHGSNPLGSSFGIHGTVDTMDAVTESMFCIGQNQPEPDPNELIFLGRYRFTSSAPADVPLTCRDTATAPVCRFEVIVRDNDSDRAPSRGDHFHIALSNVTDPLTTMFESEAVLYSRSGYLSSGNLTVD